MENNYRLPEFVRPIRYDLFFEPNLKDFTFKGKEKIEVEWDKEIKEIVLHSSDLNIDSVNFIIGKDKFRAKIKTNKKEERIVIKFEKKFEKGKGIVEIDFSGKLNDDLAGFYRSKYKDEKGKDKYLATTQFEAPYARKAFPCFDEPDKKAKFSVSLKVDECFDVLSNMPIIEDKKDDGKKIVKFQDTPRMSTYLLYMAVGEFDFIKDKLGDREIRVVAVRGKAEQGRFALDLTKKFLDYFEKYSGVKYPLPKLDMIAIPDFAAGAMENWGAITFREILLLFDEKNTSTRTKKRMAEVIAHELWHQWSGNLVTMEWWDDLWLNESFATYMAFKAVDHYFPEWKMWEDFYSNETIRALNDDMLESTHAIAVHVKSPNEIEEIFDAISYSKGGSVLRMIDSYLGNEDFRKGVSNYLNKYSYQNAVASDLWQSLAEVSDKPIKKIMESWLKQEGYPIIDVALEDKRVVLKQRRFVRNAEDNKQAWTIPLLYSFEGKSEGDIMENKKHELDISGEDFMINPGQEGFYRVNYDSNSLSRLSKGILSGKIDRIDRFALQNNAFYSSLIGEEGVDRYLNLLSSYSEEDSFLVLEDIYINLRKIYFVFSESGKWEKIWDKFKVRFKEPFLRNLKRLGWDAKRGESQEDSLLRGLCISFLGFTEDKETVTKALEIFNDEKRREKINPDIRGAIYGIAAGNGDERTYKKMKELYMRAESPEEKVKLLGALSRFREESIIETYLDFCLTDKVRIQDLRSAFPSVSSNIYSRGVFFKWVKDNWKKLEKLKKTHFVFMGFLESLIELYIGKDTNREIKDFIDSKNTGYEKTKRNSFEFADINIQWLDKNESKLAEFFS